LERADPIRERFSGLPAKASAGQIPRPFALPMPTRPRRRPTTTNTLAAAHPRAVLAAPAWRASPPRAVRAQPLTAALEWSPAMAEAAAALRAPSNARPCVIYLHADAARGDDRIEAIWRSAEIAAIARRAIWLRA